VLTNMHGFKRDKTELSFYEQRLKTVHAHYRPDFTGYGNRGQITHEASFNEAMTYSGQAVKHATEFRDAWQTFQQTLPKSAHFIDLGCGIGMTPAILKDEGVEVLSYQGFDHNEHMVFIAQRLNLEANIQTDLRELNAIDGECVVLMNHVFGQEDVNENVLNTWCEQLERIASAGFTFISIEIPTFSRCMTNRQKFRDILDGSVFTIRSCESAETLGRDGGNKSTVIWNVVNG